MRRNRRLVLIDRVIPFLAAFVGLVALAGSVLVQINAEARTQRLTTEMAVLSAAVTQLGTRLDTLTQAADDGTAEGLLALQDRMVRLEGDLAALTAERAAAQPATTLVPAPLSFGEEDAAPASAEAAPAGDCIPLGTRFMAVPNETYPLCRDGTVLKVGAITADTVSIEGAGQIAETGFGTLIGTSCTIMVFSADLEGFAELRVTCT